MSCGAPSGANAGKVLLGCCPSIVTSSSRFVHAYLQHNREGFAIEDLDSPFPNLIISNVIYKRIDGEVVWTGDPPFNPRNPGRCTFTHTVDRYRRLNNGIGAWNTFQMTFMDSDYIQTRGGRFDLLPHTAFGITENYPDLTFGIASLAYLRGATGGFSWVITNGTTIRWQYGNIFYTGIETFTLSDPYTLEEQLADIAALSGGLDFAAMAENIPTGFPPLAPSRYAIYSPASYGPDGQIVPGTISERGDFNTSSPILSPGGGPSGFPNDTRLPGVKKYLDSQLTKDDLLLGGHTGDYRVEPGIYPVNSFNFGVCAAYRGSLIRCQRTYPNVRPPVALPNPLTTTLINNSGLMLVPPRTDDVMVYNTPFVACP